MGFNHDVIGKWYPEVRYDVTADAIKAFALAVNDNNPAYDKGDDSIAPPIFAIVAGWNAMAAAMSEVMTADMYMFLVHLIQDMRFDQPIRASSTLVCKGSITGIEGTERGTKATGHIVYSDENANPVGEFFATIYVRGHGGEATTGERAPSTNTTRDGDAIATVSIPVDLDQTQRYAEASGDHNPIHLDEEFAKSVGLPGIINHGMNTLAQSCWAAVNTLCDGDSTRLRRFAGRFSKPVLPGEILQAHFFKTAEASDVFAFDVHGPNGPVVKDGLAQVSQ